MARARADRAGRTNARSARPRRVTPGRPRRTRPGRGTSRLALRAACCAAPSCAATDAAPAPPGVSRRPTDAPGSSSTSASGPRSGSVITSSSSPTPRSTDSRTMFPTRACASRNGTPRSTSHSARSTAADAGASAAACMRAGTSSAVSSSPRIAESARRFWSSASNNGSLSSCRSRLYASGRPFSVARNPVRLPISRPALPRASSAMSGFFFWGSIDDPVL